MLAACEVLERARGALPAVVHVDGSCRPQTVVSEDGRYGRLLTEVERRSGAPVVLNTSFNVGQEPIVNTPEDAIRTFFASELDALVLGDSVLERRRLS